MSLAVSGPPEKFLKHQGSFLILCMMLLRLCHNHLGASPPGHRSPAGARHSVNICRIRESLIIRNICFLDTSPELSFNSKRLALFLFVCLLTIA